MRTAATSAHARVTLLALLGALAAAWALAGVAGGAHETALVPSLLIGAALILAGSTSMRLAGRPVITTLRLPVRSCGCSDHVEAPTAYWCAVPAPARPRLPRAPGQG